MRRPFVIGLAVLALLGATSCGGGDGDDAAAPDTATAPADTGAASVPELTTCSATDHGLTLPEQELPPAVAEVRERIFAAVSECDLEALEEIGLEKDGFEFSFDESAGDSASAYWSQLEANAADSPMYVLALILTMSTARNEAGAHTWPGAYTENPTDAAWQEIIDAVLYTPQEIDEMRAANSYTGWRTAITADGDWQLFVEGD
jgi:hypothetical protein